MFERMIGRTSLVGQRKKCSTEVVPTGRELERRLDSALALLREELDRLHKVLVQGTDRHRKVGLWVVMVGARQVHRMRGGAEGLLRAVGNNEQQKSN